MNNQENLECVDSNCPYTECDGTVERRFRPKRSEKHWNGRAYCDAHWAAIEFMLD